MDVAINIQRARKAAGLTQAQLAEKIGKGFSTVQKYELGLTNPPIDVVRKIAEALGVPLADLVSQDASDNEYELICNTLNVAGLNVAPAGVSLAGDADKDIYYISRVEDPDDPDLRIEIEYSKLANIIHQVLEDADAKKEEYIQKRLDAEFSL